MQEWSRHFFLLCFVFIFVFIDFRFKIRFVSSISFSIFISVKKNHEKFGSEGLVVYILLYMLLKLMRTIQTSRCSFKEMLRQTCQRF